MSKASLKIVSPDDIAPMRRSPVEPKTLDAAKAIVDDVRRRGETAVREHGERYGDLQPGAPLTIDAEGLNDALSQVPPEDRTLLARTAKRIDSFARAQAAALHATVTTVPGGRAGHQIAPVERAGCYAPGGRFPLPSSVLMTAVTARAAGVEQVWVASPRPSPITLAAAAIARVDGLLVVGGAQGIAALAYGAGTIPACDVVVGPGNRFVTAAKQLVTGQVGIDMLAGPSELVILADGAADPQLVAADLLAQAEHDDDAIPILVALDQSIVDAVNRELERQLGDLSTADTARRALRNGFAVIAPDLNRAVAICDRLAPEHLSLQLSDSAKATQRLKHYGALFIGSSAAEVIGDYGAGPNHTLPTGGTARYTGGLCVFDFLRVRTWIEIEDPAEAQGMFRDAQRLAELEGLAGHARSAALRTQK